MGGYFIAPQSSGRKPFLIPTLTVSVFHHPFTVVAVSLQRAWGMQWTVTLTQSIDSK